MSVFSRLQAETLTLLRIAVLLNFTEEKEVRDEQLDVAYREEADRLMRRESMKGKPSAQNLLRNISRSESPSRLMRGLSKLHDEARQELMNTPA